MTAEEYAALPADGRLTELVQGRVVELNRPETRHGAYCVNIATLLKIAIRGKNLGRVVSHDPGVVTRREPDNVRGGDVHFYGYAIVPKGPMPRGYWPSPELIFEVRSPSDRWVKVIAKAQEYLEAGVQVVVVADPAERKIHIYTPDAPTLVIEESGNLDLGKLLPSVLPNCAISVTEIFDEQ